MKSILISFLLGATAAVQLRETTISACEAAGVPDVSCGPTDLKYFAEGAEGTEHLGHNIIMVDWKDIYNPYSFAQKCDPKGATGG